MSGFVGRVGEVAALREVLTTAAEFWAELERGEREGWLCSGVVCFTVSGHTVI